MDANGNTITATSARDARVNLNAAMLGYTIPDVTICVWRDNAMPYMLHLTWKAFAALIAEPVEMAEAIA